jgi:quercetin dioxygenase-like cupin family protein
VTGVRMIRPEDLPAHLGEGGRRTRVLLDPQSGHPGLELYEVELHGNASSEFHTRPYPEALIVTAGTVGVETRDGVDRGEPGMVILIPAGVEHRHINIGTTSARFFGIFAPPAGNADQVRAREIARD